jgi:hypothetical protein
VKRRPEQWAALLIEAALSRYKAGIVNAGVVERVVPCASLTPFAPGDVIAIFAVGISRLSGRAKDAPSRMGGSGKHGPRHHGRHQRCQQDGRNSGKPYRCHSFFPGFGQLLADYLPSAPVILKCNLRQRRSAGDPRSCDQTASFRFFKVARQCRSKRVRALRRSLVSEKSARISTDNLELTLQVHDPSQLWVGIRARELSLDGSRGGSVVLCE